MQRTDESTTGGNGHARRNGNAAGTGRKRAKWPFIVVALLLVHVLAMTLIVMIATRDPSFAVAPNYYERGVAWDESRAALRASAELGWKLEVQPATEVDPLGRRLTTLVLTDADGKPIANAAIDVVYFHHSHAKQPASLQATTGADGRAQQTVPMRYAGFYDFRCTAVAEGKTFTATITQFVNNAPQVAAGAAGRAGT